MVEPQQPQAAWTIHWSGTQGRTAGRGGSGYCIFSGCLYWHIRACWENASPHWNWRSPHTTLCLPTLSWTRPNGSQEGPFWWHQWWLHSPNQGWLRSGTCLCFPPNLSSPRFFGFCLMAQWLEMVLLRVIPQHGGFLALWVYVQVTGENSRNRKPQGFFHLLLRWQNENHGQTETLFVALGTITNISNT